MNSLGKQKGKESTLTTNNKILEDDATASQELQEPTHFRKGPVVHYAESKLYVIHLGLQRNRLLVFIT